MHQRHGHEETGSIPPEGLEQGSSSIDEDEGVPSEDIRLICIGDDGIQPIEPLSEIGHSGFDEDPWSSSNHERAWST